MKRIYYQPICRLVAALSLGVILLSAIFFPVHAVISDFVLDWWSIDGGSGNSQGGQFALRGTIGQPDTGTMSGEEYTLQGGFIFNDDLPAEHGLFLPLVTR